MGGVIAVVLAVVAFMFCVPLIYRELREMAESAIAWINGSDSGWEIKVQAREKFFLDEREKLGSWIAVINKHGNTVDKLMRDIPTEIVCRAFIELTQKAEEENPIEKHKQECCGGDCGSSCTNPGGCLCDSAKTNKAV